VSETKHPRTVQVCCVPHAGERLACADRKRAGRACTAAKRKTIVVMARHSVSERVTIVVIAWGEQRRSPVTICHEVAVVSSRKGTDAVGATAATQDPAIALRLRPPRLLLLSPGILDTWPQCVRS
jgi:hypothetical protein